MEADLFQPGNILYADGHALKSTNGSNTVTVVGSAMNKSHAEGVGEDARFWAISGFHQINKTTVIAASWGNHCLMIIDRLTRQASWYAGGCLEAGYVNGDLTSSRFSSPIAIIADRHKRSGLILADRGNNALRIIDTNENLVSTLFQDPSFAPRGMAFDGNDLDKIYITSGNSLLYQYSFLNQTLSLVAGKLFEHDGDDGEFSVATFSYPREIIQLKDELYAVSSQNSNRIRLIDMKNMTVTSICPGTKGNENGSVSNCQLDTPRSLALLNDHLLIGEHKGIRQLKSM
ncbi:hypothetical protein EB796_018759 [Bugula neritina]|uniref:NHLRC2 n=1 Tax=Bugula neritina TaxID=10212 RepID=A0A7J7JB91_BUGNE|nr:hypothetical protein EB796_018759 [Bugula neritina]